MNSKEALRTIERYVEYNCDKEFEIVFQELDRLEKVKNLKSLIEEKIENTRNDLKNTIPETYRDIKGKLWAYTDILLLLKEVLENV